MPHNARVTDFFQSKAASRSTWLPHTHLPAELGLVHLREVHTLKTKMAGIAFSSLNGWGSFAIRGDVSPQNMLACSHPASDAEPYRIDSVDLRTGHAQELFAADESVGTQTHRAWS
jgi:hypothetical protein